ncbi:MmgE/PrpD family protein [Sporosarcina ureilytica]|uniref:2-methylcitrate dehydratase n=1 Tax=Sporosarcina ureilytica TaxID=298596 RepID=A0A1D8JFC2_9BACL|nr:MmgE/PrpD family protein [Sporosarcina ureilytica]AOV07414.1 hypothetical protein BI350_07595 [Sporosarcina ureilytica]
MNYLDKVASFAHSLSIFNITEEVRERVKLLILDTFTAIVVGNQHLEVSQLADSVTSFKSTGNNELGFILGTNMLTDYRTAAFINGIGMVSDELDEGNQIAKGHPACHYFSALLMLALQNKKSGSDFLTAFIVNYEISVRMGASVQLKRSIHPHGNWGVFANGFGVGKLLGWENKNDYIQAAMLSTSFSMPTLWQSVLEGHQVRNIMIGLNNLHTTLLPDLVESGFSASAFTPEKIFNGVLADSFDTTYITKNLGEEFYLLSSYFKFYPYCRFCHSPIDATLSLIKGRKIDEIKGVYIETYSSAAKLKEQKVENEFAGKFSIPYAVAMELSNRRYPLINGREKERKIQELMKKIFVFEKKLYTELLPNKRITTVKIEWENGETNSTTVQRAKGDIDEYKLTEKVILKSKEYLFPILGEDKVERFIETVLKLDRVEELTTVIKPLVKEI